MGHSNTRLGNQRFTKTQYTNPVNRVRPRPLPSPYPVWEPEERTFDRQHEGHAPGEGMHGTHFDALARQVSSRRIALGGLLAGLLLPLEAVARGKGTKSQRKQSDKRQKEANAQAESC
jgi:hypothetical protein